jgi:hypothetical protein
LGWPGFEGHFSNQKGHLKGEVISNKFSGHTKKFSGYISFSLNINYPKILNTNLNINIKEDNMVSVISYLVAVI